jgi:hypothetical protein
VYVTVDLQTSLTKVNILKRHDFLEGTMTHRKEMKLIFLNAGYETYFVSPGRPF